jgi:maltose/moltooligosaccharide transporter
MKKPRLSFGQLWNMDFGFLGIQFGWGLQMANMSYIYSLLGAKPDKIPILWLAAPFTGLFIQPIIGYMSDRTWCRLGRRRPFFLIGAVFGTLAIILMPHSTALWMAVILLWMMDLSVNISMEPFRALVADNVPDEQRNIGFAMQGFFVGLGAILGYTMPWILQNIFGVAPPTGHETGIPQITKLSFLIGAVAYFIAVMWTIISTKEYPPEDMAAFKEMKERTKGLRRAFGDIFNSIRNMPKTMKELAWVQFFTWMGLFCMFMYFTVAIAKDVLYLPPETASNYKTILQENQEFGGLIFAVYPAVCFIVSLLLPRIAKKLTRKYTHMLFLFVGAGGLVSLIFFYNFSQGPVAPTVKFLLILPMIAIGLAWASILAMPYAILAGSLPEDKIGLYMGVFNFFITLPQIVISLGFGWIMLHLLKDDPLKGVVCGGVFMAIGGLLMMRVKPVPPVAHGAKLIEEVPGDETWDSVPGGTNQE